ncbi:MAG TPA: hypothetical protein VKS82_14900 [Streptosporangiaceae bacterium]|nr:hypothetical protein [Streptosporangiaceae bacterium]
MTTSGTFSVAWKGASYPGAITTGPDGNLWFTVPYSDEAGRLTPSGAITAITVPHNGNFGAIAQAPNGAMWFTDLANGLLARIPGS